MDLPDLDQPNCLCGRPMSLRTIEPVPKSNETHMHTFVCETCAHQLRVMNDRADYDRRRSEAALLDGGIRPSVSSTALSA
jgi:hypothetical protein